MAFARGLCALILLASAVGAVAQPDDFEGPKTVTWTVQPATAKAGGKVALTLRGAVQPGWHVYGLNQLPGGPTSLLVTVDANPAASTDGKVVGSPATKVRDAAFNLDTQFYAADFTLTVPVRLNKHLAGPQTVPVAVRFQTCNGKVCQPPHTVHLSAAVTLQG